MNDSLRSRELEETIFIPFHQFPFLTSFGIS